MVRRLLGCAVLAAGLLVPVTAAHAAGPAVAVTPTGQVHPGATVTVSGTGFGSYERVDIYLDTVDVAFAATDGTGAFAAASLQVPASTTPGTHLVSAEGHHSGLFAQAPVTVGTDWSTAGFGAAGRRANPYENVLGTGDVAQLEVATSTRYSGFANGAQFVVAGGVAFVSGLQGLVVAVSVTDGSVLWRATLAGFDANGFAPVVIGTRVFFADDTGALYAFATRCGSHGATCTPLWQRAVGSAVTANLTAAGGLIYVSAADGDVHPFTTAGVAQPVLGAQIASNNVAASTPIIFTPDGSWYFGRGSTVIYSYSANSFESSFVEGGTVSDLAASNDHVLVNTSDGYVQSLDIRTHAVVPSGCELGLAIAAGHAYGAACSGGAYDVRIGTTSTAWLTNSGTYGAADVVWANGVVYACGSAGVQAYRADTGALLWTGGVCSAQPEVVNGAVITTGNGLLSIYRLGVDPAAARRPSGAGPGSPG